MDGYKPLLTTEFESKDTTCEHAAFAAENARYHGHKWWTSKRLLLASVTCVVFTLGAAVGCGAGVFLLRNGILSNSLGVNQPRPQGINSAARIPIPPVELAFVYNSSFSKEPPAELNTGQVLAEPIWDALIPSKLP